MSGGVYLIQGEDRLLEMSERPYDSEALLQELLEKYPKLLGVEQPNQRGLRNWLIVKRTGSLPVDDTGVERWSLNHLFLDQQAIPTLVEVQRDGDERWSKEMIGQMLDYAAHVLSYWPVESILAQFEANCHLLNRDPEQVFEEFLGTNSDEERFWQQVKTNLQAGKIRLVFVADRIPTELHRIVEFLNKQMDPAEVLAVEIKQFISLEEGLKTLVSKVIGQTAEAQQKKISTSRERRQWDEQSFLLEYRLRYGEDDANFVQEIYDWCRSHAREVQIHWGTGEVYGGFVAQLKLSNITTELFFVGIDGTLQIASDMYANLPPFDREDEWNDLRNEFSSIGLALPMNPAEKRLPNFQLSTLPSQEELRKVLKTFDVAVEKVKQAIR